MSRPSISPPSLHSEEDDSTLSTLTPSLHSVTHLALLLHAAKAEYTYWRARVKHLSTLLSEHKSALIASHSLSEQEAFDLQLQADAEAQLMRELDREAEAQVEEQLRSEGEERVEREVERQLLIEAGVVGPEEEGDWRRVGITGRDGVRKRKSLTRPVGVKRVEEIKADNLEAVKEAPVEVGILEADPASEEEEVVPAPQPPKTEEQVFEESHGKARWTHRRSLRRNMRTMNDLRSFARTAHPQDSSDSYSVGDHQRLEPVRRQSLPSLRHGHKTREHEYYHQRPPSPPEEQEQYEPPLDLFPPAQPPKQAPTPTHEPISPPPSPPLQPQLQPQSHPAPEPSKPRSSCPDYNILPRVRGIPAPVAAAPQGPHPDIQTLPSSPSPLRSSTFTRAQEILLDLKSPIKGLLRTHTYISPAGPVLGGICPPPSSSVQTQSMSTLTPKSTPASSTIPFRDEKTLHTGQLHPPCRPIAEKGYLYGGYPYEIEALPPPIQPPSQENSSAPAPPPPRLRRPRLKTGDTSTDGSESPGYARILERKASRRYVKDERWGWKAI